VLLREVVELLAPAQGDTIVDCTAGAGGHALNFAQCVGPGGALALIDLDPASLATASAHISETLGERSPAIRTHRANFAAAPRLLAADGLAANVVLADLGFSSAQMDDPVRGFSMRSNGPLDMRLDPDAPVAAAELVNTLSEQELATIFREYGEEPAARAIARKLVARRAQAPIETTTEFADCVRSVVRRRRTGSRIDPATRAFQALRIAVNDELGSLQALLRAVERSAAHLASGGSSWLAPGAQVGVIAFHSLEDRAVKRSFQRLRSAGLAQVRTKKPVTPTAEEVARNPRSRSAKLRVVVIGNVGS